MKNLIAVHGVDVVETWVEKKSPIICDLFQLEKNVYLVKNHMFEYLPCNEHGERLVALPTTPELVRDESSDKPVSMGFVEILPRTIHTIIFIDLTDGC